MTLPTIFCPKCDELILEADHCPVCSWQRPLLVAKFGEPVWAVALETKLPSKGTVPLTAGSFVYFSTGTGQIVALDTTETEAAAVIKWRYQIDPHYRCHSMAAWQDYLLLGQEYLGGFPTPNAELIILTATSGEEVWRHAVAGASLSAAAIQKGMAYFTVNTGWVYAIDLSNLQEKWRRRVEGSWSWSPAAPTLIPEGLLLLTSRNDHLTAFALETGDTAWVFSGQGWFPETPVVRDDLIYTRSWDRRVYALDVATGQERWHYQAPRDYGSNLWVGDDYLYIGVKDYQDGATSGSRAYALYTLDRHSGERVGRYQVEGRVIARPIATPTAVFFATDDRSRKIDSQGTLYALDPTGQNLLWDPFVVEQRFQSDLQWVNNLLIAGTRQGAVYAIQTAAATPPKNPQVHLEQGAWEQAAIAYARQGDYAQAAALYADKLEQPLRAGRLYLHAGQTQTALEVLQGAEGETERTLARTTIQTLPDATERGRAFQTWGDHLAAAQAYQQAGALELAGDCFQAAQEWEAAQTAYKQAKAHIKWRKMSRKLKQWQALIEDSLARDDFAQAAKVCQEQGRFLEAAQYYDQAGLKAEAVAAYQRMNPEQMTETAQHHLAHLAEEIGETKIALAAYKAAGDMIALAALAARSGRYQVALEAYKVAGDRRKVAEMLEKLQRYAEAAPIFQQLQQEVRAAENWEQQVDLELKRLGGVRYARRNPQIEQWLTQALEIYQEEADFAEGKEQARYHQDVRRCEKKLMQIRREPLLQISLQTDSLVVNQSCVVHYVIKNVGWGIAENPVLWITSEGLQADPLPLPLESLRHNQQVAGVFTITPQVGGQLMLRVQVQSQTSDHTLRDLPIDGEKNILLTTEVSTGVDLRRPKEGDLDNLAAVWHESGSDSATGAGERAVLQRDLNQAPFDELKALRQRLARHKANVSKLKNQAAIYGAGQAPLHLQNQIEAEEKEIEALEVELEILEEEQDL